MKIILNDEKQDTIKIDEITENYLVVAFIDGKPCILSKGYYEKTEEYTFFMFSNRFTVGNGYDFSKDENNIKKMIEKAIKEGAKVEAFHQKNWKEALQWLIDNAE